MLMLSKTALVTGASKGIGKEIAITLARSGYNVCINYNNSCEEAKKIKSFLIEQGYNVDIFKADIKSRSEVDKMVDFTIERFGSLDVLVNNAGICEFKLFTDITQDDLQKMFDVTILGAFNVTQSALKKYMLNKKQGSIVNISSIWGMCGASCEVNYSTMKAGIIGMTKALAKELSLSNIRVNAVTPGIIDTEMNNNITEEEKKAIIEDIPLQKIGKSIDIARCIEWLIEDEYVTGQVIGINGGWLI